MKEYLPIIKARSGLFRGIEESELEKLFGCLEARKQTYRKEEYILSREQICRYDRQTTAV